jgi:hypothetical protein
MTTEILEFVETVLNRQLLQLKADITLKFSPASHSSNITESSKNSLILRQSNSAIPVVDPPLKSNSFHNIGTKQHVRTVSLTFGPMSGGVPGAASETACRSQLLFGPEPIGKVISVNGSAL